MVFGVSVRHTPTSKVAAADDCNGIAMHVGNTIESVTGARALDLGIKYDKPLLKKAPSPIAQPQL